MEVVKWRKFTVHALHVEPVKYNVLISVDHMTEYIKKKAAFADVKSI